MVRGSGEAELSGLHDIKLFGVRAEWQRADRQASASPSSAELAAACDSTPPVLLLLLCCCGERSGGAEGLLAARAAADEGRLERQCPGQGWARAGPARRRKRLPSSPP